MQRRKGDIGAAIQAYAQALKLSPKQAECHQNMAVALLMGGDIEGARKGFFVAITLLNEQGREAEANALFQQVKDIVKLEEVTP